MRRRQPPSTEAARIQAREHAESIVWLIETWAPLDVIEEKIGHVVSMLRKSEGLKCD